MVRRWFPAMPANSRIFVLSKLRDQDDREAQLAELEAVIEASFDYLGEDEAAFWRSRVHYVSDQHTALDGLGAINSAYNVPVWGIDRLQRAREVGYLCDATTGWRTCPPSLLGYTARSFNFESDREEQLEAAVDADLLVLPVFSAQPVSDPGWAGARSFGEVTLPDASTMAGFDTLELDLDMRCVGHPDLEQCPAWDYIANLYLCQLDDPETPDLDESSRCDIEFGRWITTYWRPGRWVHDVSPLLALIGEGGTRRFAFYSQQPYVIDLSLRLTNQGKGYRPVAIERVFDGGGGFHDHYNWGQWYAWSEGALRIGTEESDAYSLSQVSGDESDGVLLAGADHPYHPGRYTRAWTQPDPMGSGARYLCMINDFATADEAAALSRACLTDDPATADVDESLSCVGADPADLVRGCGTSAWIRLEAEGAPMPAGAWAELWSPSKLPHTFTPPPGTTRVSIVGAITGHGFGDTAANCAEFCDHQHKFTVNGGAPVIRDQQPWVDIGDGCAEQVDFGVVPNQAGTWPYGRGGWCPGQHVELWEAELSDVALSGENTLSYIGLMGGEAWRPSFGTGARIDMSAWLVYYQ